MEKSNLFLKGNTVYILIECDDEHREPKYCVGSIFGNLFFNEIYSLSEIPKDATPCDSLLNVHKTYFGMKS